MTLLTSKIREVVGNEGSMVGGDDAWLYVGTENSGKEYHHMTIQNLIANFECIELVTKYATVYIFFIYDSKNGEYVGCCKVAKPYEHTSGFVVIDYTNDAKESVLTPLSIFDEDTISLTKIN